MNSPQFLLAILIFVFPVLLELLTGCQSSTSSNDNPLTPAQTKSEQQQPDTSTRTPGTGNSPITGAQRQTDTSRGTIEVPRGVSHPDDTDPTGQPSPQYQSTPTPPETLGAGSSTDANTQNSGTGNSANTNTQQQPGTSSGTSKTGSTASPNRQYVPVPVYVVPKGVGHPDDTDSCGKADGICSNKTER